MDFNVKAYKNLLNALQSQGFLFQTFEQYAKAEAEVKAEVKSKDKVKEQFVQLQPTQTKIESLNQESLNQIILRHDVDLLPANSLATARMEHELGIMGSYYFRAVPESWDEGIIKEIAALGHEVGYHYESLTTCNGDIDKAYHDFTGNLEKLRQLVPVTTICMHGSPRSRWDSKELWKHYDYRQLGLVGEPYFDIDFSRFFYLTDTGRRWDGWKVSMRDKIPGHQERWIKEGLVFRSTMDIIKAAQQGRLPQKVMITVHPQRWNDALGPWVRELVLQRVKNVVKGALLWR